MTWGNTHKWVTRHGDERDCRVEDLLRILASEGNPSSLSGTTALHLAACCSNISVLRTLLRYSNINVANIEGSTPLHWASRNGHLANVRLLCRRGADLSLTDLGTQHLPLFYSASSNEGTAGNTVLHYAAEGGHLEVIQYLIETAAMPFDALNNERQSALAIACREGEKNVVRYLVQSGANCEALRSILDNLKDRNQRQVLRWLEKYGREPLSATIAPSSTLSTTPGSDSELLPL